MSEFKTDGHVITNGESAMGIFSATEYLNDILNQLKEANTVIEYYADEEHMNANYPSDEANEYLEKYKIKDQNDN